MSMIPTTEVGMDRLSVGFELKLKGMKGGIRGNADDFG